MNSLYTVDIATGAATFIAPLSGLTPGQSISGMACDKSTGIMYVSSTSVSASDIYTIDLTTGALTLIGTTGIPGLIEIAIDGTGTMYGWDILYDESFIIDKFTGASTLLGSLGVDLNYAQGGNWDPASDIIYVAAYTFSGQLMTLDKTTGALTLIGPFQNGAELDCLAFPGSADNWISISPASGVVRATSRPLDDCEIAAILQELAEMIRRSCWASRRINRRLRPSWLPSGRSALWRPSSSERLEHAKGAFEVMASSIGTAPPRTRVSWPAWVRALRSLRIVPGDTSKLEAS